MDNAINLVFLNDAFDFVVIADIGFNQWDIKVVLGAQISNTRLKTLV